MYQRYLDMLLLFWKARNALRLNVRMPQVCREYALIQPHLIRRDIPAQIPQKVHHLLLNPAYGLKE